MNCLRHIVFRKSRDPLGCPIKCSAHALTRSSSDHVVAIQRGTECDCSIEVLAELRAKRTQLVDSQAIQFDALLEGKADGAANHFMSCTEWNAFVNQVG